MITVTNRIQHISSPTEDQFLSDEKRYRWQMSIRANYLLLGDKNVTLPIEVIKPQPGEVPYVGSFFQWPNQGELIAGSFVSSMVHGATIEFEDVDIYFKSKADVEMFLYDNRILLGGMLKRGDTNMIVESKGQKLNLIFGVQYDDAIDLVSHFDIRACSIALDPKTGTVHAVQGALSDCHMKRIVYNPVPHNTTLARLVKYTQKGFSIDPYQRVFLAELIKSDQYNIDLEISTGYRGVE